MEPTPGLSSIIIPTYNHGSILLEAISSALAQTAPVEVIVVNDGSTDDTADLLWEFRCVERVRVFTIEHSGLSAARNVGLAHTRGEYFCFLDSDDLLHPMKIAKQIAAMTPADGWALCDVRIIDGVKGEIVRASQRYGYTDAGVNGWIWERLASSRNYIPCMAPLVRRSAIGDLRFIDTEIPEDYHFWRKLAALARVVYVPEVLATYRRSPGGYHSKYRSMRAAAAESAR